MDNDHPVCVAGTSPVRWWSIGKRGVMYRRLPHSEGDTLGARFQGTVTQEDVAKMQADLKDIIARYGRARLLVRFDALGDAEPGAIWQDLKMLGDYVRYIDRLAIVGDSEWHARAARMSRIFTEARVFHPHELSMAWDWTTRQPVG
jgi:hypothetical protein